MAYPYCAASTSSSSIGIGATSLGARIFSRRYVAIIMMMFGSSRKSASTSVTKSESIPRRKQSALAMAAAECCVAVCAQAPKCANLQTTNDVLQSKGASSSWLHFPPSLKSSGSKNRPKNLSCIFFLLWAALNSGCFLQQVMLSFLLFWAWLCCLCPFSFMCAFLGSNDVFSLLRSKYACILSLVFLQHIHLIVVVGGWLLLHTSTSFRVYCVNSENRFFMQHKFNCDQER